MRARQKISRKVSRTAAAVFSSALLLSSCGLQTTNVPETVQVVKHLQEGNDAQKFREVDWHTYLSGSLAICTREKSCELPVHESNILLNVRFFSDGKDGNMEVLVDKIGEEGVTLRNTFSFHLEDDQIRRQVIPYGKRMKIKNTDLEVTFRRGDAFETYIRLGPMDTASP
jgi:hypothetical protein